MSEEVENTLKVRKTFFIDYQIAELLEKHSKETTLDQSKIVQDLLKDFLKEV